MMIKMKNIKYIISIILVTTPALLKAQDTLSLSLEQCRGMAVENSEGLKIAEENINKAKGEKQAAMSAYLPNISASATGVYKKFDIEQELYAPTQVFDAATGTLVPNVVVNPETGQPVIGADGNPVFNTYAYLPLDLRIQGGAMVRICEIRPKRKCNCELVATNSICG